MRRVPGMTGGGGRPQVRVGAVMAARQFIDAYEADQLDQIKPLIPSLLDQIFKLMQEVCPPAATARAPCPAPRVLERPLSPGQHQGCS